MGKRARHLIREEGLHMDIPSHFISSIADLPLGVDELKYSEQILDFFQEQTRGLKSKERYIGSSEVIESFFGKLKSMENEQSAFGFTSLILAALAHVGSFNSEIVKHAINMVKLSDIQNWSEKEIGMSLQSERKKIYRCIANIKKNSVAKPSGVSEGKIVCF